MAQNHGESKEEKMNRVMGVLLESVKRLNSGDNTSIECPICGSELVVYKPFKKKVAAKCKSDNCIKIWN
jgi:transcription elongation factor Elf1